jgi:hypothetical protein
MIDFTLGDRVRRTDDGRVGTVTQYTEETIPPDRNRFLIVRWDNTEANSQPIHQSRFERAGK